MACKAICHYIVEACICSHGKIKFSRNFTCVDHTITFGTWSTCGSGNVIYEKNGLLGYDFL